MNYYAASCLKQSPFLPTLLNIYGSGRPGMASNTLRPWRHTRHTKGTMNDL